LLNGKILFDYIKLKWVYYLFLFFKYKFLHKLTLGFMQRNTLHKQDKIAELIIFEKCLMLIE